MISLLLISGRNSSPLACDGPAYGITCSDRHSDSGTCMFLFPIIKFSRVTSALVKQALSNIIYYM